MVIETKYNVGDNLFALSGGGTVVEERIDYIHIRTYNSNPKDPGFRVEIIYQVARNGKMYNEERLFLTKEEVVNKWLTSQGFEAGLKEKK